MTLLATLNAYLAALLGQEPASGGGGLGWLWIILVLLLIICAIVWLVGRGRR